LKLSFSVQNHRVGVAVELPPQHILFTATIKPCRGVPAGLLRIAGAGTLAAH
jgi:hypothetical protein